jgi:hypothetical protein
MDILEKINLFLEKNVPTDPGKWSYYKGQAKKKFDVYPSAYANAWAAKKYKEAGGGWRAEESVNEAFTKGDFFGGKIKINGQPVPLEVELLGADQKKKAFIVKVVDIDRKYYSKLPSDGILHIPAKIFRTPGGGWYKIKTPKAF